MARKRHKPEEIVAKLRQVDVLTSQGQSVPDAIRSIGVSEVIIRIVEQSHLPVRRRNSASCQQPSIAGSTAFSPAASKRWKTIRLTQERCGTVFPTTCASGSLGWHSMS